MGWQLISINCFFSKKFKKNLKLMIISDIITLALCETDARGFAQIAQLVEQRTENPRVTGSIPVLGTCP